MPKQYEPPRNVDEACSLGVIASLEDGKARRAFVAKWILKHKDCGIPANDAQIVGKIAARPKSLHDPKDEQERRALCEIVGYWPDAFAKLFVAVRTEEARRRNTEKAAIKRAALREACAGDGAPRRMPLDAKAVQDRLGSSKPSREIQRTLQQHEKILMRYRDSKASRSATARKRVT